MGAFTRKPVPSFDGSFFKFLFRPENLVIMAFFALPNRKGQSPIPVFLTNKPVVHVCQPVHFAVLSETWNPLRLFRHRLHSFPEGSTIVRIFGFLFAVFPFFNFFSRNFCVNSLSRPVHCYIPLVRYFPDKFGFTSPT